MGLFSSVTFQFEVSGYSAFTIQILILMSSKLAFFSSTSHFH
jgi:hypothetical protein